MNNYNKICVKCETNLANRADGLCQLCFEAKKKAEQQAYKDFCKNGPITVTKLSSTMQMKSVSNNILANIKKEEENLMKAVKKSNKLRTGDKFFVKTNAEFLNQAFGTNYKGWMRCGWKYAPDVIVWMVWLDGEVREGWLNTIIEEQRIVQEDYVGKPEEQLYSHRRITEFHRIVVKRDKGCYTILGLYKCDKATRYKRVWRKVSDEI